MNVLSVAMAQEMQGSFVEVVDSQSSSLSASQLGASGQASLEDTLVSALLSLASTTGVTLCRYRDESARTNDARLHTGPDEDGIDSGIESCVDLVKVLHRVKPDLVFAKETLKRALESVQQIMAKKLPRSEWAITGPVLQDWLETIQRRIRNCCRALRQNWPSSHVEQHPDWIKSFTWLLPARQSPAWTTNVLKKPSASEVKVEASAGDDEPLYGFFRTSMLPFRKAARSTFKEPGLPIDLVGNERGTDWLIGQWPDGHRHALPITVDEFKELRNSKKAKTSVDELWAMQASTGNCISIRQKKDHSLLIAIFEQGKAIMHCKANVFGQLPSDHTNEKLDPEHEVIKAAVRFLAPIAEEFAKGAIQRADLLQYRDQKLAEAGLTAPPRPTMKRPAAAIPVDDAEDSVPEPEHAPPGRAFTKMPRMPASLLEQWQMAERAHR